MPPIKDYWYNVPTTDFPTQAKADACAALNQRDDMDGWSYRATPASVEGHWIVMVYDEAGEILGAL